MKIPAERTGVAEKAAFAERLKNAIGQFDETLLSPTVLAREFNRRSKRSVIGVSAAYKWLSGDAIPQQERLVLLAGWLRVPVLWLRYGEIGAEPVVNEQVKRRQDKILSDFLALSERDQQLIENLMREMLKQSR